MKNNKRRDHKHLIIKTPGIPVNFKFSNMITNRLMAILCDKQNYTE